MISQEALAYLRLSLVSGVGSYTAQQLIAHFGSVDEIWHQPPSSWQQLEGIGPALAGSLSQALLPQAKQALDTLVASCVEANIHLICEADAAWPEGLNSCSDAPLVLYVQGELSCLASRKVLAMVGARRASAEGKLIARRWSAYVSKQGVCVISGMAPGIDSAAHGGSLDAASAGIAVLGYGLQAGSLQQLKQIEALSDKGCVISEYRPDAVAKTGYFPQRNRLIAGIAQALLVVEGGLKSGSLITARQALNYGRELFAVPGSVLNDIHAGCHQLIQDGAILASDVELILHTLAWHEKKTIHASYQPTSKNEALVCQVLAQQTLHIDALAEDCNLTVPKLSTILLRLELQGVIERLPGSRYILS